MGEFKELRALAGGLEYARVEDSNEAGFRQGESKRGSVPHPIFTHSLSGTSKFSLEDIKLLSRPQDSATGILTA